MADERPDWGRMVGDVARRLAHDDYPSGHLAELRRLKPDAPDGAAFWRLVADFAEPLFDDERGQRQCVLAAVVRGMAVAHPFHAPAAGARRPLGVAMAEAEVAEVRLLRLLRLGGRELPEELRRLARLMASKGDAGRFDWSDAAWLLLTADTERGEEVRRRIARDFYRTAYKLTKTEDKAA
jgi:CRISPR type I-E-associated protein CasB/Cse2